MLRLNIPVVIKTREIFHGGRVFSQDCEDRDFSFLFFNAPSRSYPRK